MKCTLSARAIILAYYEFKLISYLYIAGSFTEVKEQVSRPIAAAQKAKLI
jgi:hypothetical protein